MGLISKHADSTSIVMQKSEVLKYDRVVSRGPSQCLVVRKAREEKTSETDNFCSHF